MHFCLCVLVLYGASGGVGGAQTEADRPHLSISLDSEAQISNSVYKTKPVTNPSAHDRVEEGRRLKGGEGPGEEIDYETWVAPEYMRKNYPYYHAGFDDEERPIWVAELGKYHTRAIIERGERAEKDFENYVNQASYRMHRSIRDRNFELGENGTVTHCAFLIDFDGLSINRLAHLPTMAFILGLARRHKHQLNEIAGVTVFINTNYAAEFLLNAVRPLFGRTFENTEIYGTNIATWIPRIRRFFPRNSLPEWYGGSKDFKPVAIYG